MFATSKLPQHFGQSGWVAMLAQTPKQPLSGSATADIVVIGGDFAGLSAARRLSQLDPKLKVVILEAGEIAEGATGRNSGFVIDLPHEVSSEDYGGSDNDARRHDIKVCIAWRSRKAGARTFSIRAVNTTSRSVRKRY